MSTFTNYETKAASEYDIVRLPIGNEIMLENFSRFGATPLDQLRLIDFGSGSGAYDEILLQKGNLAHISLVDASKTMLDKAERKLTAVGLNDRVDIINGYFDNIPRADSSYTGGMTSMVIHHLVSTGDDGKVHDWSPIVGAFEEANRLLEAGSVFLVAFSTPEQRGGNWYAHLVPQSRARTIARCPAKSQVVSFLERAGFDVVALQNMTEHYCSKSVYYDDEIFFKNKAAWYMDSLLSGATADEIESAKDKLEQLRERGELKQFLAEHDNFKHFGCGTIITAVKRTSSLN